MKKTILYAIVVLVILVIAVLGWYYFSSTGQYAYAGACPKWKCTDTQTYTCPAGTTSFTCLNGKLDCYISSYNTKDYLVNHTSVKNETGKIVYWYKVNEESVGLGLGEEKTLSDGTRFGVTSAVAFYLNSSIEFKQGTIFYPLPSWTTVNLKVSVTGGGLLSSSCPSGYTPSCSGSTLTCRLPTTYICSSEQPFSSCTKTTTSCRPCAV